MAENAAMLLLIAIPLLTISSACALWLSPGERAHKDEFWAAWEQRYGPINAASPPVAMFKTWYRQFKKTGVAPGTWLEANVAGGPPGGSGV